MTTSPLQITDEQFDETVVQSDLPVLVDFWAPWCGPCKMIAPVLEELAGELGDKVVIAKVNTDQNPIYAQRLGVQGIPTMVLFKDGAEVDRVVGALPKGHLKQWIDTTLTN
jgi:thioredoxin 1